MAPDQSEASRTSPKAMERITTSDLIDRLSRFDGPPEQFLASLLAVQCRLSGAVGGVILRLNAEGRPEVLAAFPPVPAGTAPTPWLIQAAELAPKVIAEGTTTIRPSHAPDDLYGQPADRHLVLVPLKGGGGVRGVSAFLLEVRDPRVLGVSRERIELTSSLLSLYEMRLTLQQRQTDLRRLRISMETLSAVSEHDRFAGSAMAACNEVAARWNCDRVSVGFLKGRFVHLKAMSHTEKFNRKMKLVQDVEAAMEECLDQDVEVLHPAAKEATYVSRATAELARMHGQTSVLSLPLRKGGQVVGVLTAERPLDRVFNLEELESLRLTCELLTPHLAALHESDRWLGARVAASTRKLAAKAVGPTHTWVKLLVLGVLGALLYIVFAKGDYMAEGNFTIQPVRQQAIQAPFDARLVEVLKQPNDMVQAGEVLARLDCQELLGRLAEEQADLNKYQESIKVARSQGKVPEMRVAEEEAQRVAARIAQLQYRIDQSTIRSPMAGRVITGDWMQKIGTSVQTGQAMFEVAPLQTLRAELLVPEDQIADIREGFHGELAATQYPDRRLECVVNRIYPVAEVKDKDNVFKVRLELVGVDPQGKEDWLRPGVQGVGKIKIDRRSYAWLWTHQLVNWVRMKFWI